MQNTGISIRFFAQYIRHTKNNTIDLLHQNKDEIMFALGLKEKDVLTTPDGSKNKLVILTYYDNGKPSIWITRFNKGGFAYGGFNTDRAVAVAELGKLFTWVNYGKAGLSDNIAKEFELYGNP